MSLTTRIVTATYKRADDTTPATGTVTFAPNTALQAALEALMVPAMPVRAVLDASGHIAVTLICTDSSDVSPSGWAYVVTEQIAGAYRSYSIQVATGAGSIDLSAIAPTVPGPAVVTYVLASAVGAIGGPAGPLDSSGLIPSAQIPGGGGGGGASPSGTVVTETAYGQASTAGTSALYSRGDHTHGSPSLTSSAASTSAVGDTAAAGSATTPAKADHVHGREAFAGPGSSAVGDTTAAGSAATPARSDHRHGREAFGTPGSSAVGDAAAAGVATTVAHSDHTHGREAFGAVTAETSYGLASSNGAASTLARSDHMHGSPALGTTGTTAAAGNDSRIVGAVQTSRQVISGTGLTGGGDLSADRTLAVLYGTAAGTATPGNDARLNRAFGYPASNYGMVALSIDPALCQTASSISSGFVWAVRVPVLASVAFSSVWFAVRTAGTWDGVTSGNQIGLYNDAGTQLDTTAVDNTLWTAVGWRGGALLGGAQAAQSTDRDVYLLIIIRGASVNPSLAWPPAPSDASAPYVAQGPAGGNRRAMYTSGNTALPASFTPSSYGTATGYVAVCGCS